MKKYFEMLMTSPCEIKRKTKTVSDTGTPVYEKATVYTGNSNIHSLNIQKAEFADRIGTKTAYLVCVPLETDIKENDIIEFSDKTLSVVGVRQASVMFEKIAECVIYE